jgi:hypothetical protein
VGYHWCSQVPWGRSAPPIAAAFLSLNLFLLPQPLAVALDGPVTERRDFSCNSLAHLGGNVCELVFASVEVDKGNFYIFSILRQRIKHHGVASIFNHGHVRRAEEACEDLS